MNIHILMLKYFEFVSQIIYFDVVMKLFLNFNFDVGCLTIYFFSKTTKL